MSGLLDTTRVDLVGSFLRPAALLDVYAQFDKKEISEAQLTAAQDDAIRKVITRQNALGLPLATDGEFRRLNFQDSFANAVSGYAGAVTNLQFHLDRVAGGRPGQLWDPGYRGAGPPVVHRRPVVERLRLVRNQPLEEYVFASGVAHVPVKVSLIGPDRIIQRFEYETSRHVYLSVDDFVDDVVAIERQMVAELIRAGCRYVHIDAPGYTAYVDEASLGEMRARGEDPDQNLSRSIAADNAVIRGSESVTFGIHLCRGNQRSMWHRHGAYDGIAERLFNELDHRRFLLEYDTDRAGTFEPLRFVPKNKVVVLGLVSTKTASVERAGDLMRRLEEASHFLPLEQLAISPQCGFASDISGNLLTEDDQWRKLEVIMEVAAKVWG